MGYIRARMCEWSTWLGLALIVAAIGFYVVWHDKALHHALFSAGSAIGAALAGAPGQMLKRVFQKVLSSDAGVAAAPPSGNGSVEMSVKDAIFDKIGKLALNELTAHASELPPDAQKVWQAYLVYRGNPGWVTELEFGITLMDALAARVETAAAAPTAPAETPPPAPVS
jgi:hypothetical protein